ncbi:MAG: PAS domain S-box protein [Deltaproteobacteria bacterium]|nr:PAS domain S-box protein [Deltaproteobacteria bacterium]
MDQEHPTYEDLTTELQELRVKLTEAEDTLEAIRSGAVDSLVISGAEGAKVYSLAGTDAVYRTFFQTMDEGAVTLNAQGMILSCNHKFSKLLGLPFEKILGNYFELFVVSEDIATFKAALEKAILGEANVEISLRSEQNEAVRTSTAFAHLPSTFGELVCVVITDITVRKRAEEALERANDELERRIAARTVELQQANERLLLEITERKLAQEELRVHHTELEMQNEELHLTQAKLDASRARYFDLYDMAPVGYLTVDEKGMILEANLTAANLLGVKRSDIKAQSLTRFIFPEDQDVYYLRRKLLFETEKPQMLEIRALRRDGSHFWARLETTVAQDDENGRPVCRVVISDITEHKGAEQEALRKSHEMLRLVMDNVPQYIFWKDRNSKFLGCNRRFAQLCELPDSETIAGKTEMEVYGPNFIKEAYFFGGSKSQVLESAQPEYHLAESFTKPNGQLIWVDTNKLPLLDADGRVIGLLVSSEDITERKKAEEHLELLNKKWASEAVKRRTLSKKLVHLLESDRLELARELHDNLGQKLTALKMDLERTIGQIDCGKPNFKERLKGLIVQIEGVMGDINRMARGLRPLALDNLGLIPSIQALLSTVENISDLKIYFSHKRIPKHFEPDKELALYRVAQEALNNVLKHALAATVHVNLFARSGHISLTIEDDGRGFDPQAAHKAVRGKTSLGLLLMEERITQLGGHFTIETSPNKGTIVLAELSLNQDRSKDPKGRL